MSYPINNFTIDAVEFYTPKHITDKSLFNILLNKYIKYIVTKPAEYKSDDILRLVFEYSKDLDTVLNDLCTSKGKTLHIRLFDDNSEHYETIIITGYMYRSESILLDKNSFNTDREIELGLKYNFISRVRIAG